MLTTDQRRRGGGRSREAGAGCVGPATLDDVDLRLLAEHFPTPFYAYSATAIRGRVAALREALAGLDARICFAVKANPNLGVLNLMAELGVGADIVSAGELRRSLHAGIPPERVVFSGVGKTEEEIALALAAGIWKFNVESADELRLLQRVAEGQGAIARAAVRVNPDVDAGTHEKISTGKAENKFGVSVEEARSWFAEASAYPNVRLDGLHAHIGSQILDVVPFRRALGRVAEFWRELAAAGHALDSIDVGGGLGVRYRADADRPVAVGEYAGAIRTALADFPGRIVLEPGRWLVAEAGVLVTRAIRIKPGVQRDFLVLDAAMNDLLRPALYEAWHDIVPLHAQARPPQRYDVVGPVCETGDTFARDRLLPRCEPGDLLLIAGAGAYGASMGSTYNSRPLPAEVLLDRGRYALVRRRQTFEEMVATEQLAQDWQRP
ncbi:diaminopimelate decarboxylase [Vulcaniibacterium tengchongense]|uniref:Diaminopimelate decarboxylase n=1 Tax=Vulcaniibacterium tengchongense TaxID=1273429 RepID=A0A3N4VBQ2_9GAMM|nr:diaminopimelate decarboxylase [Vulcaniibacterium tengchongense]RPE77049.1 diaminopimelate decarboxylase [Vulcaniibacterium tengchongense]